MATQNGGNMKASRRMFAQKSSLGLIAAGFLSRFDKVAAAQTTSFSSMFDLLKRQATGKSEALLLKPTPGEEGPPAPATEDRLPLDWNKRTVARLKDQLAQTGVHAFLVRDRLNTIYLTGYWHTTTERPEATFMNQDDADPWFMYPGLDRNLVRTWWFGSGKTYFDFKDDGSFPYEGKVVQGKTVDMFRFLLEGIKEHGIQGNKIGIDGELYPSETATAREVLPGIEWIDISKTLMDMRIVKTPEELALWRRAYVYFDRAHAFARDYILTHGTDITDYEVGMATELWINQQLYSNLKLDNGKPHRGVQTNVELGVRAGPVTAYPHPNQPLFNRIGRGMALQVSGGASVGGYGGENYRMYIIADKAGEFDPHMRKLWEVSQRCCDMQMELQVEGETCSNVAYKILKYQVDSGVQQYIFHRPAHGSGSEGHQAPYLSLGDYTVLKKNMCFSEEPGLYDQDNGCGFNWSDTVVTGVKSGYRMSRVPYSKEWCWIKI
jgi:Xaa-Pro dipeptidase